MEKLCAICKKTVDSESAAILTIGGYGNPRYVCSECESDIDTATKGRELDSVSLAMERLGNNALKNADDELAFDTVKQILEGAKDRAQKIKSGEYDFSLDDAEEDVAQEIPEELRETEEDKLLDEEDERLKEESKKADKWFNLIYILVFVGVIVGFLVYKFFL